MIANECYEIAIYSRCLVQRRGKWVALAYPGFFLGVGALLGWAV